MLLPMFFRCDSDRSRIPVRKALLIIPAGGCVCVGVSVCVSSNRENREGSLQTIMVHFFPSSSGCLRVKFFFLVVRHKSTYFVFVRGGLY